MKSKEYMYLVSIKNWSLFVGILMLASPFCHAQRIVSGKVVSSENGEPVPYVNIIFVGLSKGTVSGSDGTFRFSIPGDIDPAVKVKFSHIGFNTFVAPLQFLMGSQKTIRLTPSETKLEDFIVLNYDPRKIVKRFQDRIEDNMVPYPHEIEFFYRELIETNGDYAGYLLGHGFIYSQGIDLHHSKSSNTSAHTYNFITYKNIQKTDYSLITGPTGRARSMITSMWFPSAIFELWDFKLNWFDYHLVGGMEVDGRPVYVMRISEKNNGVRNRASKYGNSLYGLYQNALLYIDQEDYGLHFMELSQKFDEDKFTKKSTRHTSQKDTEGLVVKYHRNEEGKYQFTYAKYTNQYFDFGYETEENPDSLFVKELAEIYALDHQPADLTNEQLAAKYHYPVSGEIPRRRIHYHSELYNRWIFSPGKPVYSEEFWKHFTYPTFPKEEEIFEHFSKIRPLSQQYQDFTNMQLHLLKDLQKRHGMKEGIWNKTGYHAQ